MNSKVSGTRSHGFTVRIVDEEDGLPRLLASGLSLGAKPRWYPLDAEALASFTQRTQPPWGHIWQSSRDFAEDAARATRGAVCEIEEDAAGVISIRVIDPIAEAVAAEREACAKEAEAFDPDAGMKVDHERKARALMAEHAGLSHEDATRAVRHLEGEHPRLGDGPTIAARIRARGAR
jgi:hypothetical protein